MLVIQSALRAEAEGFINALNLKRDLSFHAFELFFNSDTVLIISGIGTVRAAAAISALLTKVLSQTESENILALNFGTAGCQNIEKGRIVLPLKITSPGARSFYPEILCQHSFTTGELVTSEKPVSSGKSNLLYDMEASAFFEAASLYLQTHQILSLKVISDNLSPADFSLTETEKICLAAFNEVLEFAQNTIRIISSQQKNDSIYEKELLRIANSVTLTFSQRRILQSKIRQAYALNADLTTIIPLTGRDKTAFRLLTDEIEKRIKNVLD